MKKYFIKIAEKIMPSIGVAVRNFSTLVFKYGQWRSVKERMAVDALGSAIPWYTYPAIEYLKSFDFKNCDVFEYGSGNSSLYWAGRAESVVSVESDLEWFNLMNKKILSNQLIIYQANCVDYVGSISRQGRSFDIIVIDGNWRLECTVNAINFLKSDGMIVLDNSDRKIEKKCGQLLRERGFFQIDFSGFGPINGYCWSTSIFMKNSVMLQRNFSGPSPIGGLDN